MLIRLKSEQILSTGNSTAVNHNTARWPFQQTGTRAPDHQARQPLKQSQELTHEDKRKGWYKETADQAGTSMRSADSGRERLLPAHDDEELACLTGAKKG